MTFIFVHGLGQNSTSWDEVSKDLSISDKVISPNLNELVINGEMTYQNLYKYFCELCNNYNEPINLCGLSLGSILCLNYAIDNPHNVSSLVLIAPQYKIPKLIFKVQNLIFKLMPHAIFRNMGFSKKDTLILTKSMTKLDLTNKLPSVICPTFVLCGSKDSNNLKASKEINQLIDNSEFHLIPHAKHEVNIENPSHLSRVLNDFYNKI